jgi:polysaccharide pyruvyl transferase WcaK-like protein
VPAEKHVVTLGAAFSANRGAASMLQAVIDNLPDHLGPCRFSVLTTFPDDDRDEPVDERVTIVSLRPAEVALLWPLAALAGVLRLLRLPWRWLCVGPALRHLHDADVVVDVAGISFADGRGIPIVVYNALMTSLPILLGRPTVKASQALGPFRHPVNRALARIVLPRLRAVCPRGDVTEEHVRGLGLHNVEPAADLAFTMRLTVQHPPFERPTIGLAPSAVVDGYCRKAGIDYPALLAAAVDHVIEERDVDVVVFPHSSRRRETGGRMDDRTVARAVHAATSRGERCLLVDDPMGPVELRALIARCEVLVTSRFHAMISALATSTPVLVVGWSHKYAEVLREVGLDGCAVDWRDADPHALAKRTIDVLDRKAEIRSTIDAALPAVTSRSMRNYEVIAACA